MIPSRTFSLLSELFDEWATAEELSPVAANRAINLLILLKDHIGHPTVHPDGDGGMVMYWEAEAVLVVVDDTHVHIVERAATKDALYHDYIRFEGNEIPNALRAALCLDKPPTIQ